MLLRHRMVIALAVAGCLACSSTKNRGLIEPDGTDATVSSSLATAAASTSLAITSSLATTVAPSTTSTLPSQEASIRRDYLHSAEVFRSQWLNLPTGYRPAELAGSFTGSSLTDLTALLKDYVDKHWRVGLRDDDPVQVLRIETVEFVPGGTTARLAVCSANHYVTYDASSGSEPASWRVLSDKLVSTRTKATVQLVAGTWLTSSIQQTAQTEGKNTCIAS